MRAAIHSFVNYLEKNKIVFDRGLFILGDMYELGEKGHSFHKDIGKLLEELGAQNIIFVGKFAKDYQEGLKKEAFHFENVEELKKSWDELFNQYEYFFIKGSRGVRLEGLI